LYKESSTGAPALFQRRVIEKGKAHRCLYLVNEFTVPFEKKVNSEGLLFGCTHDIGKGLQDIAGADDPHQLSVFDDRQAANLVFEQELCGFL